MPDEVKVIDEVDEAVDALMNRPDAMRHPRSGEIETVLRIAADLRQLPVTDFRSRLRAQLLSIAPLPRLIERDSMMETIPLALAELEAAPALQAFDTRAAVHDMPELSMRFLTRMDAHTIGVSRFSHATHWERHPAADELLYLLEGDADITTLTAHGPTTAAFPAGSLFICPRGLWHLINPRGTVSLFFMTPPEGTESVEDPHFVPDLHELPTTKSLAAVDLRGVLPEIPLLDVDTSTTEAEAEASFRRITELGPYPLFASRFRGLAPWERHENSDELLHVLEGDVELTVLTDAGPVERSLARGSIIVCPRGLWHRQRAARGVTILSGSMQPTQISWADDPRL